jgi:hypothetical protein
MLVYIDYYITGYRKAIIVFLITSEIKKANQNIFKY